MSLLQRLVVTGFALLIPKELTFLRILLGLLGSLFYLTLLLATRPVCCPSYEQRSACEKRPNPNLNMCSQYAIDDVDVLAIAAQFSLVVVLTSAMSLKLFDDISFWSSTETAVKVLSFSTKVQVVAVMLLFTFAVLILFVGLASHQASHVPHVAHATVSGLLICVHYYSLELTTTP